MHNLILSPLSLEALTEAIALKTIEVLKLNGSKPQTTTPEKLLSKKEVIQLLGITLNTLDSHVRKGTIPAYGLGARLMFKKDEVLASLTRIN